MKVKLIFSIKTVYIIAFIDSNYRKVFICQIHRFVEKSTPLLLNIPHIMRRNKLLFIQNIGIIIGLHMPGFGMKLDIC
jgi:hypothetical protein